MRPSVRLHGLDLGRSPHRPPPHLSPPRVATPPSLSLHPSCPPAPPAGCRSPSPAAPLSTIALLTSPSLLSVCWHPSLHGELASPIPPHCRAHIPPRGKLVPSSHPPSIPISRGSWLPCPAGATGRASRRRTDPGVGAARLVQDPGSLKFAKSVFESAGARSLQRPIEAAEPRCRRVASREWSE